MGLDCVCGPSGTNLAQCHTVSISWHPGQVLSITPVSMSLLPSLSVGTNVHPALVCIRLGNPGGLGSTYLTYRNRNVLLIISIFWSFANLRASSWACLAFDIDASDAQL